MAEYRARPARSAIDPELALQDEPDRLYDKRLIRKKIARRQETIGNLHSAQLPIAGGEGDP